MKNVIKKLMEKLFSREVITYGITGGLTTLVNIITFMGLVKLHLSDLTANAVAWVVAVVFAYIVNKTIVFQSKSNSLKDESLKIIKFFGARLVSLGFEELGIYIFIILLDYNRLVVKVLLAVFVIIINYFFSKLYIFKK